MSFFPNEIWCKIFEYLDPQSRNDAKLVCKLWLHLIITDPKPKHMIFDNVLKLNGDNDTAAEYDWNYKRILKIISDRPNVKICQFNSYSRCTFLGSGFKNFVKKSENAKCRNI